MHGAFTMYSTTWCGHCHRLKHQLRREGIPFEEVDIDDDRQAARLVELTNHGTRTVPTLVFSDGSALTNPSVAEVMAQLAS